MEKVLEQQGQNQPHGQVRAFLQPAGPKTHQGDDVWRGEVCHNVISTFYILMPQF